MQQVLCAMLAVGSATPVVDFYGGGYAAPLSYGPAYAPAVSNVCIFFY